MRELTPEQKDFLRKLGVPEERVNRLWPDLQECKTEIKLTIRDFMLLGGSMTEEEIDEYAKTHPEILE